MSAPPTAKGLRFAAGARAASRLAGRPMTFIAAFVFILLWALSGPLFGWGAAMLMRVETAFRLFGYPGLAMLCFLAAATGGLFLVGNILLNDRRAGGNRR